jgi:rhodanese-related sulfurtransferase
MSAVKQLLDHKLLRSLSPLCDLTPDMLTELSAKSRLEDVASGVTIFSIGERDHRTLYLIAGKLELTDASGRTTKLAANTKQARQPLNQEKPRSVTAVAVGAATLLNIDTSLLEMLVNWGSSQTYEVSNLDVSEEEETDWMSRFLQSKVFLKLHAENIQAMMMRMETVPVRANDVIIKQGDVDENYYIIAKGRAKVARRATPDAPLMKLAVLTAGSGFGEEALIANSKRNATVVMMEDGELMRLSKEDFINLLITPVLQYLTYDEAKAMDAADVEWLDVRKLDEYSRGSLPGAKNTPVTELRLGLRKLNKLHKYIVFSDTDDRAGAAVFLLNQNGLDAYVLKDGLAKIPKIAKKTIKQPPQKEQKITEVSDDEPITDVKKFQSGNVVKMRGDTETVARQRVEQEIQRNQTTEQAQSKAKAEVARLRAEVDASRKRMEEEAKKASKKLHNETDQALAEKRAKEIANEKARHEEALQRAEAESAKAKLAAAAKQNAEAEIERLKKEAEEARKQSEVQAQKIAAAAKKDAEAEIARLKAETEAARQSAAEQAELAANKARSEAERKIAQQQAQKSAHYQQEMEDALKRAEFEAMRAEQSEQARREAEREVEQMRDTAAQTQLEMEKQTRLAADQARSDAERKASQQRAEELAAKQQEIESAMSTAETESARALAAERELEKYRKQADETLLRAEEQARLVADAVRAEAEAEIQRFREEAEVARMQLEEQAQRVADSARSETEREAARAKAAEESRLQAETELERLAAEVAQIRMEIKAQASLASDNARTEEEREEAYVQAEVLAEQQKQTEAIARRAEEEAERAQMADEARQRAENEITRREQEAAEAARRAEEEAQRAQEAADVHRKLEQELVQLRAEAEAAQASTEGQMQEEARAAEADEAARKAAEGAKQAKINAEKMRQQAEEDIKRLKAQAEAARIQAEIEVKRSIAAARREVDPNDIKKKVLAKMQAKADLAAGPKGNSASEVAQRTRAARAAREAGIESLMKDDSDDLDAFFNNEVVDQNSSANSASDRAQRMRAVMAAEDSSNDYSAASGSTPNKKTATEEEIDNLLDNDNLIDPTEVMEIDFEEQKKHWDSDDHAWEAAVGHRTDPNIERYDGKLPEGLGGEQQKSEVSASGVTASSQKDKTAENIDIDTDTPKFEAQEIDRSIRPQVNITTRGPARETSKAKLVAVSLIVIVAIGAGGWFYAQDESAPKGLKRVVNQSTESIVELTDISTESLIQLKDNIEETLQQISEGEADGKKPLSEEDMVKLRERLEKMKAESKRSADNLAKQRAAKAKKVVQNKEVIQKEEPAAAKAEVLVEPIEEPMLTPPANNAPKPAIRNSNTTSISGFDESESEVTGEAAAGTVESPDVVESVEGLPVIDTEPAPAAE